MATILITGAGGQVGQALKKLAENHSEWTVLAPKRTELDITNAEQLSRYFVLHQPDYCLNTAAYTAVDKAESESTLAYACNAAAVEQLAALCTKYGTHLIHFSTDYVYQDGIGRPLRETDPVAPKGVYAASKLQGDEAALAANGTVIRTSWVYHEQGHNFVKTMLRLGEERDQLSVVFDQVGTPTYAPDLAAASLQIINQLEQGKIRRPTAQGIFHYSNEGVTSWYDFALAIFELDGIDCSVQPIRSEAYPTPAKRPHYSVLDKTKIKSTFGISIPHWRVSLQRCLSAIQKDR